MLVAVAGSLLEAPFEKPAFSVCSLCHWLQRVLNGYCWTCRCVGYSPRPAAGAGTGPGPRPLAARPMLRYLRPSTRSTRPQPRRSRCPFHGWWPTRSPPAPLQAPRSWSTRTGNRSRRRCCAGRSLFWPRFQGRSPVLLLLSRKIRGFGDAPSRNHATSYGTDRLKVCAGLGERHVYVPSTR